MRRLKRNGTRTESPDGAQTTRLSVSNLYRADGPHEVVIGGA